MRAAAVEAVAAAPAGGQERRRGRRRRRRRKRRGAGRGALQPLRRGASSTCPLPADDEDAEDTSGGTEGGSEGAAIERGAYAGINEDERGYVRRGRGKRGRQKGKKPGGE